MSDGVSMLKFFRKQSTPDVAHPEYVDEFDKVGRIVAEIVATGHAPQSDDLPARWLTDSELYPAWIDSLPWTALPSADQPTRKERWRKLTEDERRFALDDVLKVEASRRLPAKRKLRAGWELVEVPGWEPLRSGSWGYLERDGKLFTVRCPHGMTIPPLRGGMCPRGCRPSGPWMRGAARPAIPRRSRIQRSPTAGSST